MIEEMCSFYPDFYNINLSGGGMWQDLIDFIEKNPTLFLTSTLVATIFGAFLKFIFDWLNQKAHFRNEYYKRLIEEMLKAHIFIDKYLNEVSTHKKDSITNKEYYLVLIKNKNYLSFKEINNEIIVNQYLISDNIMENIKKLNSIIYTFRKENDIQKIENAIKKRDEMSHLIVQIYNERIFTLIKAENFKKILKNKIKNNNNTNKKKNTKIKIKILKYLCKVLFVKIEELIEKNEPEKEEKGDVKEIEDKKSNIDRKQKGEKYNSDSNVNDKQY